MLDRSLARESRFPCREISRGFKHFGLDLGVLVSENGKNLHP